jgi:hypothetical protein
MDSFTLRHTLTLNQLIIKLYSISDELIDIDYINSNSSEINSLEIPSNIIEYLELVNGVSKIEIYDASNNLLVSSSKLIF